VEVIVVVYSISPGWLPAISGEENFEDRRGVQTISEFDGTAIKQEGEARIIGCLSVVLKKPSVGFAFSGCNRLRAAKADQAFGE
jgi:hypothetical protein